MFLGTVTYPTPTTTRFCHVLPDPDRSRISSDLPTVLTDLSLFVSPRIKHNTTELFWILFNGSECCDQCLKKNVRVALPEMIFKRWFFVRTSVVPWYAIHWIRRYFRKSLKPFIRALLTNTLTLFSEYAPPVVVQYALCRHIVLPRYRPTLFAGKLNCSPRGNIAVGGGGGARPRVKASGTSKGTNKRTAVGRTG